MKLFSEQNFEGKKVLVRVDFNVPLDENFNVVPSGIIKVTF